MTMTYRFVQLSDIHFGQERGGTLVVHEDVRRKLIDDAADLAKSHGPANLVIIVGDTAYGGKDEEYVSAGVWLDSLTAAVGCKDTDVRIVPGNHDCDRAHITTVTRTMNRAIRNGTAKSAHSDLDDMAKGPEEQHPLLPKLKAYRQFAASYDSDFRSIGCPLWTKDFPLSAGISLRLVGMNSVQVCNADEEDRPGNMVLGNAQYVLPDEPHLVYLAILHHPLEWYMDKAEAKPYLHNRACIIMVGHEHIPDINKTVDLLGNERLDISSGATNPPESGELYRFAYNWIEVSLLEKAGTSRLAIRILPRVWVPERTQFAPDTQRLAGQDSAKIDLACPRLKPKSISVVPVAQPATIESAAPTLTTDRQPGVANVLKDDGAPMEQMDDAALARLRFLFWRHLDWQQRLKVLVQVDVLPATAGQPVPQTMERMAIETARQQGKLAAMWDAMTPFLPPEKQQPNPFHTTKK